MHSRDDQNIKEEKIENKDDEEKQTRKVKKS
jgi:hypothetical protein